MGKKKQPLTEQSHKWFMQKWNVPDYRKSSAYPKPKDLNDTYWRWEFLRRRKDYREEWEKHYQLTYEHVLARSKDPSDKIYYGKKVLSPDHPQFQANNGPWVDAIDRRTQEGFEEYKISINNWKNFGLVGGLPNPAISKPFSLSFNDTWGWMLETGKGESQEVSLSPGQILFLFDLNKPLPGQLEKAKADLQWRQKASYKKKLGRRQRRDLWPTYLRVLDARDAGLTYLDIGKKVLKLKGLEDLITSEAKKIHKRAYSLGLNFPN